MSALLAVLAEPSRQSILRFVWTDERTAGDIAARLPVTFSAVSQHLKVLRDNGLVEVRRDGRRRWYRARREALGPLAQALEAMWAASLDRLAELAEREERHGRG
jgi:DNA-binding transcriptional ArsR family regulator